MSSIVISDHVAAAAVLQKFSALAVIHEDIPCDPLGAPRRPGSWPMLKPVEVSGPASQFVFGPPAGGLQPS